MAQDSKNKRRLRRLKRQISLHERILLQQARIEQLERGLRQSVDGGQFAKVVLLAVLAQKGGEVEVTQGTMQQVTENLATLSWVTQPNEKDPGAFLVKLVEGQAQEAEQKIATGSNVPQREAVVDKGDALEETIDQLDGSGAEDISKDALQEEV